METKSKLRIVFMGTPEFAVTSLDALVKHGYNVVGVVTAPDKPAGRGQQLQQSAVKKYAIEHNLNVLQPEKLKDEGFISSLKNLNPDLQIVVAFRMLPEIVWNMPTLGTFNLHASLLPHYRGAAPINWAVINGEKETGLTTFFLQQEIDTGKIIFNEKTNIGENETAGELHDRLMIMGAKLILKTVKSIEEGTYSLVSQETIIASAASLKPAPKIFKDTCRVNWNRPLGEVHNLIRGLSPYPAAWTEIISPDGKIHTMKIYRTEKLSAVSIGSPGSIVTDGKTYMHICTADFLIAIKELQLAGKKRMSTEELLRGFQINNDWKVL